MTFPPLKSPLKFYTVVPTADPRADTGALRDPLALLLRGRLIS